MRRRGIGRKGIGRKGIGRRGIRVAGIAVAVSGAAFLVSLGSGGATASTSCGAANGQRVQHIVGYSACAATAGPGSRATAEDMSPAGTAVSVANSGGNATARNMQPGSTALAGASNRATAYSVTTGPAAQSVAQANNGATALALGGWGGQSYASPRGTACLGGFAMAYESSTGKMCLRSGSVNLQN